MTSTTNCCPIKGLGVVSIGHRRQPLKAIAALRIQGTPVVEPSPPSSPTGESASLETTADSVLVPIDVAAQTPSW
jgi:hypothetical protein